MHTPRMSCPDGDEKVVVLHLVQQGQRKLIGAEAVDLHAAVELVHESLARVTRR